MVDKQCIESIYYSSIKGEYRVPYPDVIKDIQTIAGRIEKEKKEPSISLIVKELKEMYKGKEIK